MSVMGGPDWTVWPAPAKLNLFLRILGRRADDYHVLQTVFQLIDWLDEVHLRTRDDGQIVRVAGPAAVPAADDLSVRAAHALAEASGCALGVDIALTKRIPMGGGFGGGSSDAATVLVALNHLWRTGLSPDALAEIGLRLGADVPVFVRGDNAWAEGIGELLRPIMLSPAWYVIIDPGVHIATSALFSDPELTRAAEPATIAQFVAGEIRDNAFEPLLRRRDAVIEQALVALSRVGSARVTGTGAGCFAAYDSREAACAACSALPEALQARVVRGLSHSPLHDCLRAVSGNDAPASPVSR
ncbi:MAG: 4-(cytidine 5'-diphospho)-2-C-methyl-D-erythritol kinase [Xanthomonadaceae bacterium]|nr:4-(cytidine 5'-diphospho)-2-C-methyl-D-erythritol kinase [Xanthomonadaceae bacterium]MDP2186509.1 4-(cytidine 5'-diphospho)-2-C-methyl-D-erythritol kinase [Xanthomonadales bacterium]MDZ4115457.1 4-(cytidine 5'-diphospho)-2-C-methyl-D-erythritol kinase [Xanthomonadaceae bacterium]MDZ4379007.1 4-(cytidine 5'-diphospho)-2-C-methyl-D-erythritol kinase [Xanthomonadaceae bacterium]